MANAIISMPIPYIGDFSKGRPIFNGQIFVGEPDLDPEIEANQKQIVGIQENGTEVNLSQPVLTGGGGYPTFNGSPIRLAVDGAYSLKILDRKGNQEYFFDNVLQGAPVVFSDNPVLYRDTVAIAVADTELVVGRYITTKGFTSVGDDGHADYIVVAAGTGTDDGILFIDTSNGLQLQRLQIGIIEAETMQEAVLIPFAGIGDTIVTSGRLTVAIGGGTTYSVVAAGTGTADGGSFIDLTASGNQAKALFQGVVNASQFGVVRSGDETTKIQAAIDFCNSENIDFIEFDAGEYQASGLTSTNLVSFRGNGAVFTDITNRVLGTQSERFNTPAGFSDVMPFSSYTVDAIGNASVDVDVEQLWLDNESQGVVVYYVDWVNGSDANPGTVINSPLKTINAAAQKSDVGVIQLMPVVQYDGLDSFKPIRDIEIRSFSGEEVIIRMGEDPADFTFTVTPATTFEYQTVISRQIRAVFDNTLPDGKGGYAEMTLVEDSVAVNDNPGSWFYETGISTLFVRMFTDRAPGVDLVMLTTSQNILEGDQAIFLKNVKIEGGQNGFEVTATNSGAFIPRLYMQDCRIFYSANQGVDSNGAKTFLERVEVVEAKLDNLNYHDLDGTPAIALEIDVKSRGAGLRSQIEENNNASTMHETGTVVRINGDYYDSYGPTLPDTDSCMSLNVGIISRDSQAPTPTQNVNFLGGTNAGGSKMFCHYCLSKGSVTDYSVTTADIFVSDSSDQGVFNEINSSAHVQQYWPEIKG